MPRTASSAIAAKLVGGEIKAARTKVGISQVELGKRLGVTGGYIASVEAGRHNLTIGQLMNIASALRATLDVRLTVAADEPILVAVPPEGGLRHTKSQPEPASR